MSIVLVLPSLGNAMMGIDVQPGASLTMGAGVINMHCRDLTVIGTISIDSGSFINIRNVDISGGHFNAGSGQLALSGNWINNGTFTPGTSLVSIQDGCSTTISRMEGNTTFFNFSAVSAVGKILQVAAGSTQVFLNSLTLEGGSGNPLVIQSDSAGNTVYFSLDPSGTQDIAAVDVSDNDASGGQLLVAGSLPGTESMNFGNLSNWSLALVSNQFVQVPTLSRWAVIVLILALATVALQRRRMLPV